MQVLGGKRAKKRKVMVPVDSGWIGNMNGPAETDYLGAGCKYGLGNTGGIGT